MIPNQPAADRPRLRPDKPGVVNVPGLDGEAALSWTAQESAAASAVYSSCIVPALNNRSANYRVDAVSTKGKSATVRTGSGKAQAKGSLLGTVYFDSTESNLTKAARSTLSKMVNDLKTMGLRAVAVNGYADSLGSQRYNQALSMDRASSVRAYLEGHITGLVPDRRPFGETQPVRDETHGPGHWQNRRVEIRAM